MRFGEIVKKAWALTWRYRMLWVLGLFAGATGGSFTTPGGSSSSGSSIGRSGSQFAGATPTELLAQFRHLLPVVFVFVMLLMLVGVAFWIISIGARGGLIWAVNEIEERRVPRLSQAWDAGFHRFWSVFGLGLLLHLPLAIAWFVWIAIILSSVLSAIRLANTPTVGALVAPACGALAIGLPILLIASFVIGMIYLTGLRFVMLNGLHTVDAAREGWRAFRARMGDHVLMALLTMVLNTLSGLVIAIPIAAVAIALAIPGGLSLHAGNTSLAIVLFGFLGVVIVLLIMLFAAVWCTFTSAMWTIFFRRLTGREPVMPATPVPAMPAYGPSGQPQPWGAPQPPAYPYPQPPAYPQSPAPAGYPPAVPQQPTPPQQPAPPMAPQPPASGDIPFAAPEPPIEPGEPDA